MGTNEDSRSDEELMRLYQNGVSNAFEILYARHSGRVYAYLCKKTSTVQAADILQEAFLKLHGKRDRYSSEYPFLPWLFTIARNALFDHCRLGETKIAQRSNSSALESILDLPASDRSSTDGVVAALQALPSVQKRAIELRYLTEWSFEQIAAEMKTSPSNVRQIVSRGIKKLRLTSGGKNES